MKYKFYTRIIFIPDQFPMPEWFVAQHPPLTLDELIYVDAHPNCTVEDLENLKSS